MAPVSSVTPSPFAGGFKRESVITLICFAAMGTKSLAHGTPNTVGFQVVTRGVPEAGAAIIVTAALAELAASYVLAAVMVTEGTAGGLSGAV
jgi:hypothetical protein